MKSATPSTMTVRAAGLQDVPTLVTLMDQFYAEAGFSLPAAPAEQAFRTLLDDPRLGRVWIGYANKIPAGYVVLTLGYSMEFGGTRGFIDDFFVLPSVRGKGLGAALLATLKKACDGLGVCALVVETGLEDHPARSIYARAGFQDGGRVLLHQALRAPVHEMPAPASGDVMTA